VFHEILKLIGLKKESNFYLQLYTLGRIFNIQKSYLYSKRHIHFTTNAGIFIPEYWLAFYNHREKEVLIFPTESDFGVNNFET
jgi:hypothetical protein